MNKTALILLLLGLAGVAYASGPHKGGHHEGAAEAHWQAPQEAINQMNPIPANKESIEAGKMLYMELCSRCHGESALGDGPDGTSLSTKPTNLRAMSGGHPDGDFAWKIKNGRNDMPDWGEDLDDTEIWNLVNFIQSLSRDSASTDSPSHKGMNHGGHAD